ncbi:hypothetical protein AL520_29770 [Achromobacter xylosoxidans]|nr:hypothetical protein AL520_29770 [Achromobacter xylosoxidans]
MYCLALYRPALCCLALYCLALYRPALCCLALHCRALYCLAWYCRAAPGQARQTALLTRPLRGSRHSCLAVYAASPIVAIPSNTGEFHVPQHPGRARAVRPCRPRARRRCAHRR